MTRDEIDAQTAARLEDARWMAETGECLDGAARRLGIRVNTLEAFLRRHDLDCLATLMAHQPRDHNRAMAEVSIYDLTGYGRTARDRQQRRIRRGVAA